jgi:hypothetical protein
VGCHDRGADPDPACTPGSLNPAVTQATIGSTICLSGYSAAVRPWPSVSNHLKVVAAADYGIATFDPSQFEGDHLVPIGLGGNPENARPESDPYAANPDDVSNFWDEPHAVADGADGGSGNKDKWEAALHRMVCRGTMSLARAQRDMATDWYGTWVAAGRPTS